MTTETVKMPTAYLIEVIDRLQTPAGTLSGGIDRVPVQVLAEIVETCEAIIDEVERWRAEAGENSR